MKDILGRFKSPVVIAQLLTILGTIIVTIVPEFSDAVEQIVYALTIIINVFAGVNNPTDRKNF